MKIATFLPNWVGDAVMATPALRGLRNRFRDAEIVAVLRPPIGDVLAGTGLVDRVVTWNPKSNQSHERGLGLVRSLRREAFDLAVLFPNSLRSGWMAWCSGAKRRVGFGRNGRWALLTDSLEPRSRKTPNPVLDEYLRLVETLGGDVTSRRTELATLPADEERLLGFWNGSIPDYVCLNPGGAFGAAKHWPAESFGELGRKIAEEHDRSVLVVCGPAERDQARSIVAAARHPRVISLADVPPSIGLTKAAVRRSSLLVTTDSGPRHFAQPFDVPVVTLFGPTHIAWSETYYDKGIHLQIPVDCGPCQQRTCPLLHHRCMKDLSVDQVFDAVTRLLTQHSKRNAA